MIFYLKKHYFDGIDSQGNAIIVYAAELRILGLKIPFSSYIFSSNNKVIEKSFLKNLLIHKNEKIDIFFDKKMCVSGTWNTIDSGFSEDLFRYKDQILKWNCHHPKAAFNVVFKGFSFSGFGYAETIELPFFPWKLPISELKWGRFLSQNHTIVWIEWIGNVPIKKVYWNGILQNNVRITREGIYFDDSADFLSFTNPEIIKSEPLLVLATKYSFLKLFFPKKFLQTMEIKYKSKSTLHTNSNMEQGWSLYETVLWNK